MKLLLQKILKYFAKAILAKYHPEIIGITGSAGKSTTTSLTGSTDRSIGKICTPNTKYTSIPATPQFVRTMKTPNRLSIEAR